VGLRVPSAGVHLFPHLEVEVLCPDHLSGGRQGRLPVEVLCPDHLSGGRQGRLSVEVLCQAHPWGQGRLSVEVLCQAHPWGVEVLFHPVASVHPAASDRPCPGHPWGVGVGVAEVGVAVGAGVPCPDHLLAEVAGAGVGVGVVPFQADPLADHLSGGRQGRPSVAGLLALRPLGHRGCHQLAAAERWRRRLQASKALQKQES